MAHGMFIHLLSDGKIAVIMESSVITYIDEWYRNKCKCMEDDEEGLFREGYMWQQLKVHVESTHY